VHTPPYQPEGRGEIERFFRSVREQFLAPRHEVVLEKVLDSAAMPPKPFALPVSAAAHQKRWAGRQGTVEFLAVIFEPGHEEFEHFREWAGSPVHAEF
jgi:hypothetical protein